MHLQAPLTQLKPLNVSQGWQDTPHTALVSPTHAPPAQLLKPVLQRMPQEVPLQVAVPRGSVGQGVQLEPQLLTLVFETQLPLQAWYPPTQLARKHAPLVVSQAPVPFAYSVVQLVREVPQTVSVFCSQPPLKTW